MKRPSKPIYWLPTGNAHGLKFILTGQEEKYRAIVENSTHAFFLTVLDGTILETNNAASRIFGYSAPEFKKLKKWDFIDTDDPRLLKAIDIRDKTGSVISEVTGIKKSGERFPVEITSTLFTDTDGTQKSSTMVSDITEKTELEKSLNQERRIRHQQITEAVITGQENERTQLGEELHDNINQILASTKLYLECALKAEKPRADLVTESKRLIEKAMIEIRKLSKSLLPPSLGQIGLLQALNDLADNIRQVNELFICIRWQGVNEKELSSKLKLTIFRIVQEQLNNVIKHAHARNVIISISRSDDKLQVTVKDDGKGFDADQKRNGVGLRNICSRAEVNNGSVIIDTKPGAGCELIVHFILTGL